ncbi:hypothetical protein Tco_0094952, partial [Tanacetum coccineum]
DSNDDTDDDDEEPFEDEDDDEQEEKHLAPAYSFAAPIADLVPSAGDTEAFETDKSAPIPRSPQTIVPFAQTRLRRVLKTVILEPPMSASMEARIAEYAAALTPPLPITSPPLPLPSPLTTSPTDAGAPLGYRATRDSDESCTCLTTPAPGYEIGESSAAGAARQPGSTPAVDTWDEIVEAMMEMSLILLLDRGLRSSRERLQHRRTALAIDREAHVRTLEAQVATLIAHTTSLQTQLTTALGRIATLEARDPEPQDGPAEAGSSS